MSNYPFAGQWICAPEFAGLAPLSLFHREMQPLPPVSHPEALKNVHIRVEKTFDAAVFGQAKKRQIRITADDYYKLYLNGRFVGQGPAPGYYFSYYYNEFDLAPFLQPGQNRIQVDIYYQGLINRVWNSGDLRQGMIADLLADGKAVLSTDHSWLCARDLRYTGKRVIGYDTQYLEDVDERLGFSDWTESAEKKVDYTFCSAPFPAVSVWEAQPVLQKEQGEGLFFDFGQERTGTLRISASGREGDCVVIYCGEELDESGQVRWQMRCGCDDQEFWTLKDGDNLLEQYDYKGFRYVRLDFPKNVTIQSVSMLVRHFPFPEKPACVQSENPVLEQIFTLCTNGVRYGSQESFIDCPTREKGQYTGDLTITGASHLLLTADPSLLRRAIALQVDSLRIAPGMLAVTPGSWMQEIADYSLQFPLSVWRYYQFTGDRAFLREMLPACQAVISHFAKYARSDGLLDGVTDKWNLVDWPEGQRDGYDFPLTQPVGPGCHNVINAFYVGSVRMVEQIQRELGLAVDGEGERLKDAFNRAFFREQLGRYVDWEQSSHSSLHANCLPAFFGLIPAGKEQAVGDWLVDRGMACGVYMAFFLLKGLARLGRYQAVWDLLVSQSETSWYNMVREGGTTCFEAWGAGQKWNTSLCHPWASAPISVLIEDLAGLAPSSPGKDWRFNPHFPASAGHIRLEVPTPEGRKVLQL